MSATVRKLSSTNKIVARHPLREELSSLSSGGRYDTPLRWHRKATVVANDNYYDLGLLPPLHVGLDEQLDPFYLPLLRDGYEVGAVYVSIYRSPNGGYEIVAYVV